MITAALQGSPRYSKKLYRNETNCYDTNHKFSASDKLSSESAHYQGCISVNSASVNQPPLFLNSSSAVASNEGFETRARVASATSPFEAAYSYELLLVQCLKL